jgi:hypothetical protein
MKRFTLTNLRPLLILFLLTTHTLVSVAQDYISEDFLDNLEANAKFILDEPAPAFSINAVPDKWKNESATVIGYKRSILFDKKSSGGFFTAKTGVFIFLKRFDSKSS